ncbi:MAG TPA: ABC transporter permease [Terriglobales bacterium]
MFWNLLLQSFLRQRRRKLLAGVAIMLGIAVATAMLAVGTDIGDKVSRELRAYGANIVVYPAAATLDTQIGGVQVKAPSDADYLKESELPKIKGIFWRHNVTAFSPELPVNGTATANGRTNAATLLGTWFARKIEFGDDSVVTGIAKTHPWWKVKGAWPQDGSTQALIGMQLAQQLNLKAGDRVQFAGHELTVSGILSAGGNEDRDIVAPIAIAQQVLGRPGAVAQVDVSALTKPEDEFARRNPDTLSATDRDKWYCSPYANSIARQIQDVIPNSHAEQIRRVAQNEGVVLSRISGLMWLLSIAAQIAAALAVSAAMATALFERRREIGLMKALGADASRISVLFFTEATVLSLLAGLAGYGIGALLARYVGRAVFGSAVIIQPILLPFVLLAACVITLLGSAHAIRRVSKLDPVLALRGEA